MTLTRRLTIFFLTTLAIVLLVFSVALYLLADRHLTSQLDDRLGAATRTLASAAEIEPNGVEWEPGSRPLALAPGGFGDQLHWTLTTDGIAVHHSQHFGGFIAFVRGELLRNADRSARTFATEAEAIHAARQR